MNGLDEIANDVEQRMRFLESKRETAISASRKIIRGTKKIIHSIHAGDGGSEELDRLKKELSDITAELSDSPEILFSGVMQDAMMEFSEAAILFAVASGKDVPSYSDLGVTPQSWLLGLADAVGEMRRMVLDHLFNGDLGSAGRTFKEMESVYSVIMLFDVPDAILPIRRKQDVARSVLERTRTDLTAASVMRHP